MTVFQYASAQISGKCLIMANTQKHRSFTARHKASVLTAKKYLDETQFFYHDPKSCMHKPELVYLKDPKGKHTRAQSQIKLL